MTAAVERTVQIRNKQMNIQYPSKLLEMPEGALVTIWEIAIFQSAQSIFLVGGVFRTTITKCTNADSYFSIPTTTRTKVRKNVRSSLKAGKC